jgi:hypothetical protein
VSPNFETFQRPEDRRRRWKAWEDGLVSNPNLTVAWLAERLDRTPGSVENRRSILRAQRRSRESR